MTDSVAVFSPGDRVTDNSTGAVVSGAVLYFYDAVSTVPKTVYADSNLSTPLGTTVTCDSLGYPTSDGTTKTQIYVGTELYKVVAKTSTGTELWTHDNVKGAVAVTDPGSLSVVATTPVVIKSLDYTVLDADQSSVIVGNCSSGDVTFTLPSAVDVGDGWFIDIQHAGSANQVLIASVSSQTISSGATSYSTVMVLSRSGESVRLVSDGGNWRVTAHSPPHIKNAQGIITVTDRLSAPPGSEVNGAIYLLTGTPSGAWSTFAEHDLAQYTSSAWVKFTPLEGWQVWVADEDLRYTYTGSTWLSEAASTTAAGIVEKATSAEVIAETADKYADTADLKHHPGIAKFAIKATVTAGVPAVSYSYNVTSVTDNGEGYMTVTIGNDFASADWACVVSVLDTSATGAANRSLMLNAQTAGTVQFHYKDGSSNAFDPGVWYAAGFGELA